MKRHSFAAGLVLAVAAIPVFVGPVAAGEQVPFKGRLEGDVTVTPLAPPFLQVDVEATAASELAPRSGQFADFGTR